MKVIVPLNCSTLAELKTALSKLDQRVDVAEIWLDQVYQEFLANPGLALEAQLLLRQITQKFGTQFLAVCKRPEEQGKFPGNDFERAKILVQFLKLGGHFIDLDVTQNSANIIAQIPSTRLWLSFHDYHSADLDIIKAQYETMKEFKPSLYKFAVTPKDEKELEAFIDFGKNLEAPAIFTTMGKHGATGRAHLKPITWGGFYALDEASKTASGQPTLENL